MIATNATNRLIVTIGIIGIHDTILSDGFNVNTATLAATVKRRFFGRTDRVEFFAAFVTNGKNRPFRLLAIPLAAV